MSADNQQPVTGDATGQPQGEQNGGTGAANDAAAQAHPEITFATEAEFQKRVDDMLKERLERERAKTEKAAQKAREEAQAEAAAANGEWQKLAEQRAAKVAELEQQVASLEAATATAGRYEAALRVQVDALRRDVPKHLLPLLDRLDVAEQLEWLAANRTETAKTQTAGVPPTPRAQGTMDAAAQDEARRASASFYREL